MKKLFLMGMVATALLASCNNDETVSMPQQKAIGFSSAFVNNGTRSIVDPSFITNGDGNVLEAFDVYGFTQNGQIFDGTEVKKVGSEWSYSPPQYWVEGNTYTFGAIAPAGTSVTSSLAEGAKKVGMTVAFTSDGETDLLHAAPGQIPTVTENMPPVGMTFNHQLSKVKFSFENAAGEGYNIKVTNIQLAGAMQTGTLTVADGVDNVWSAQTGTINLSFGNAVAADATTTDAGVIANEATYESYYEKLMIPTASTVSYTVSFTVELLKDEVTMGTFPKTATISGVELKLGYCYDFAVELTTDNIPDNPLQPIKFTLNEVSEWTPEAGQDLSVDAIQPEP